MWVGGCVPQQLTNSFVTVFIFTSRTIIAIVSGCISGVLGITGWLYGIVFYLISSQLMTVYMIYKYQTKLQRYFTSINKLIYDGLVSGALSYVMFWVLLYNIVHVYQ